VSRPEAPVAPAPSVSGGALAALSGWDARRWWVAAVAASATALVIGLPTDVIPNPMFGRPVDVTWWSGPVLAVTAVLGGLLAATYVRADRAVEELDRPARVGSVGGLLGFFAVGCPVCNKLVVVALGTTGALELFAPVQPLLAMASIAVLAVALRARLRTTQTCSLPS
jgi:hypothetical protein